MPEKMIEYTDPEAKDRNYGTQNHDCFIFVPGLSLFQKNFELFFELEDVLELPVNGCKPDIGDLVQNLEFFHHKPAYFGRSDFLVGTVLEIGFDLIYDLFQLGYGNGPFFAGLQQALKELLAVEPLPLSILFDDHVGYFFDLLVGGESFLALEAFPAPADAEAVFAFSGIDHLAFGMITERTSHDFDCSPNFFT